MKLGLIGYGGVGKAFIRLLKEKNIHVCIRYILNSSGGLLDKEGIDLNSIIDKENDISKHISWKNGLKFEDVIREDIDVLVELTPTNKDDGEPAISYIREALKNKINVVTGNKGPILIDYRGLKELADKNKVKLGIGCTTGGALPSISSGLIGCAGAEIKSITGILNGTTNYILSKMHNCGVDYEEALKEAQELGIAETNSNFDVEGYDTAIKTIILTNALMNSNIKIAEAKINGITKITKEMVEEAKNNEMKIKLIGKATLDDGRVKIIVEAIPIDKANPLYFVDDKNKGIMYNTDTLGDITITGGASGTKNAAASILRDIINFRIN